MTATTGPSTPAPAAGRPGPAATAGLPPGPPPRPAPRASAPPGSPRRHNDASTTSRQEEGHASARTGGTATGAARTPPSRPASRPAAGRHAPTASEHRRTGTAAPPPADATRHSPQNPVPSPPGATSGTSQAAFPAVTAKRSREGRCHRLHSHGDAVHHLASREPAESPRSTPLTTQARPPMDSYSVVGHPPGVAAFLMSRSATVWGSSVPGSGSVRCAPPPG